MKLNIDYCGFHLYHIIILGNSKNKYSRQKSKLHQLINFCISLFQIDGLGTYSNVAVYVALVISCMFLPSYVIKTFTVKWGLVMCMFCYTTYIATQFYPAFYTIIPGAIIVGIGAAPMWSAKCTYLTQVDIIFCYHINLQNNLTGSIIILYQ